jgi:hypothetical protein
MKCLLLTASSSSILERRWGLRQAFVSTIIALVVLIEKNPKMLYLTLAIQVLGSHQQLQSSFWLDGEFWDASGSIGVLRLVVEVSHHAFKRVARDIGESDDIALGLPERPFQHDTNCLAAGDGHLALDKEFMAFSRDKLDVRGTVVLVVGSG